MTLTHLTLMTLTLLSSEVLIVCDFDGVDYCDSDPSDFELDWEADQMRWEEHRAEYAERAQLRLDQHAIITERQLHSRRFRPHLDALHHMDMRAYA